MSRHINAATRRRRRHCAERRIGAPVGAALYPIASNCIVRSRGCPAPAQHRARTRVNDRCIERYRRWGRTGRNLACQCRISRRKPADLKSALCAQRFHFVVVTAVVRGRRHRYAAARGARRQARKAAVRPVRARRAPDFIACDRVVRARFRAAPA